MEVEMEVGVGVGVGCGCECTYGSMMRYSIVLFMIVKTTEDIHHKT